MMQFRKWLGGVLVLAVLGLGVALLSAPLTQTSTGAAPALNANQTVRLEHELIRITQVVPLPTPAPDEIALRIWVQRVESYQPYLTVRGRIGERSVGPVAIALPPNDGAFHMVELPWWRAKPQTSSFELVIDGHGVLIAMTQADVTGENTVRLNGKRQRLSVVSTQMLTRYGGIEAYLPVLRIAEGKPGLLGSPRFVLFLSMVSVGLAAMLLRTMLHLSRIMAQVDALDAATRET